MKEYQDLETHPWAPFIPENSRVLIMGTFPPGPHRWSMNFYYPNRTNDFWYMMGLLFRGDRNALLMPGDNKFDLDAIKNLLCDNGIALNDTGYKIRRLKGNASDKYLDIVEPVNLESLLERMPQCHDIATTGEKAAGVIADLTSTPVPKMGTHSDTNSGLRLWRMPSTSRAFPMRLDEKAGYYRRLFEAAGIL